MIKKQVIQTSYQSLVDDIDTHFDNSQIILQQDRNTIKAIEFNAQHLVVKSFKKTTFINRIIYSFFKKSKAKRAYEFGLKIAQFTPKVIAFIEYYQFMLLTKSYFICQKFDYDFDIRKPLLDINFPNRLEVFKAFSYFTYELHKEGILPIDYSPGNILIKQNKQKYQFKIIDINRMIFKVPTIKERAKNFNKLWADDVDLAIILTEYAQLAKIDKNYFISLGLTYNQQLKQHKTRKKKIKQLFGLC